MNFAALSGVRVVQGFLMIPLYGSWCADLLLATTDAVPTNASLTIGNLTLAGNIFRQDIHAGSRNCRMVAGFGGWRTSITAKQYQFSSGVKLSTVLNDAAAECGEKIKVSNDTSIGGNFIRAAGPASNVLRQLAGGNWYIDATGITQNVAWPSSTVATDFTLIDHDGAQGKAFIATEDYASWMPNAVFSSPLLNASQTVKGTLFRFERNGTLRLEVLTK